MEGEKTVGFVDTGQLNTVILPTISLMSRLSSWTRWTTLGLGRKTFKWLEGKYMANLGCLYSMDRIHGVNVKDDAKPKQKWGT